MIHAQLQSPGIVYPQVFQVSIATLGPTTQGFLDVYSWPFYINKYTAYPATIADAQAKAIAGSRMEIILSQLSTLNADFKVYNFSEGVGVNRIPSPFTCIISTTRRDFTMKNEQFGNGGPFDTLTELSGADAIARCFANVLGRDYFDRQVDYYWQTAAGQDFVQRCENFAIASLVPGATPSDRVVAADALVTVTDLTAVAVPFAS